MPGGLILLSPWTDQTFSIMSLPTGSGFSNRRSDIIHDSLPPYSVSLFLRGLPLSILSSPYLSPAALHVKPERTGRGSFEGFPPTFVVAGEAERLRDEIRELVQRMRMCEGVDCQYLEVNGAIHDFLIFPFQVQERIEALSALSSWLVRSFPTRSGSLPPTPNLAQAFPKSPSPYLRPRDGDSFVSAALDLGGEALEVFAAVSPSLGPTSPSSIKSSDFELLEWDLDEQKGVTGGVKGVDSVRRRARARRRSTSGFSLHE